MLGRKNSNSTDMAMELDMMDVEQPLVADTDFPRRSLLREHRTWWSLVAWLGCMGVVAGGLQAVGRPFVDMCLPIESRCDYQGCLDGVQFLGVVVALIFTPLSFVPIGFLAQGIVSRYRMGFASFRATFGLLIAFACASGAVVLLSTLLLTKPWTIQYTLLLPDGTAVGKGGYGHGWSHYGLIPLYFGGYATVVFAALSGTFVTMALRLRMSGERRLAEFSRRSTPLSQSSAGGGGSGHAAVEALTLRAKAPKLCVILTVMVTALIATACFSPVFNYSPQSFFPTSSSFALVNMKFNTHFTAKLFPDAVVYYCVMIGLAGAGVLAQQWRPLRNVMHYRVRVPGNPASALHPYPTGVSVGEVCMVAAVGGLFAFWLYYWRFGYGRITAEAQLDPHHLAQVWARVFGHLSNLAFSLLLLPAARNSMWVAAYGIPFERAVKYHRVMGAIAYMCVTVHMLIWFGKWAVEGNLWHNMTTIDDLRIAPPNYTYTYNATTNVSSCSGIEPHWDNFTIILNWIAWIGLTAMVFLAAKCRRANYELFHYVHHFAWLYYILAAMHAWGFWQYACGGLALYLVDRCVRLSRGATCNAVVSLDLVDGVSIVRLPSELLRHLAGQYAFVNIPAVSELQWHPFTISSAPSAPEVSFHMKDMGEGTWTGALASLARSQIMTEVRVDGPYGRPGTFSDKKALVLVAGGIGITPLHSLFAEVYACASRVKSGQCGSIEHVLLLWSGRSDSTFCLFAPTFHAVSQRNPNGAFEFYLYNTAPGTGLGLGAGAASPGHDEVYMGDIPHDALVYTKSVIQRGRPPVAAKLSEVAQRFHPRDVMVMTCGPEALTLSVSDLAFQHGFHFHTEVFHF